MGEDLDAVIVGSGPNGLSAGVRLCGAGWKTLVVEAHATIGGGARTAELTLPGFRHDVCSAVHPLARRSPYLRTLDLESRGLEWINPPVALAHPFDDGGAAYICADMTESVESLGADAQNWERLFAPLARDWDALAPDLLGPLSWPGHPLKQALFGLKAVRSARALCGAFGDRRARGLFAGLAAHSMLPLDAPISAAGGLVLGALAHAEGWPMPKGGAQRISDALTSVFRERGGAIETSRRIDSIDELPAARVLLLDLSPAPVLALAGEKLNASYRERLNRYRYGPGVCKVDWAMEGPIPWKADACRRAGTVHLGGSFEEIAASEKNVSLGTHAERPFVLLSQPSLFDPTRAPHGGHAVWGYCHVPRGSDRDVSAAIENQIERFAPGFRDRVIARAVRTAVEVEADNPNYVGGDINGGLQDRRQLFTRPAGWRRPYRTSNDRIYICSASTPPGGGVHGMCGFHAADAVLRDHSTTPWD